MTDSLSTDVVNYKNWIRETKIHFIGFVVQNEKYAISASKKNNQKVQFLDRKSFYREHGFPDGQPR